MKKLVGIFIGIFVIFMSYVVIGGFIQKNNIESGATTTKSKVQNQTNNSTNINTTTAFTTADVAKHKTSKDCWLIINNEVYDVSSFLYQHPGGASTITPYCGKEATKAFDTQDRGSRGRHSTSATNMLADYLVGSIK